MNIEQIAHEVAQETDWKDAAEFLRRCLSKLAEQDVTPYAWDSESIGLTFENHYSDTTPLYTETQLLAAQQRTAEACAKACEAARTEDGDGQHRAWYVGIDMCIDAIRNWEWREL